MTICVYGYKESIKWALGWKFFNVNGNGNDYMEIIVVNENKKLSMTLLPLLKKVIITPF